MLVPPHRFEREEDRVFADPTDGTAQVRGEVGGERVERAVSVDRRRTVAPTVTSDSIPGRWFRIGRRTSFEYHSSTWIR